MCVILHKKEGFSVCESDIKDAFETNPDGCGLMYREKNIVITEKGMWDISHLLRRIKALGTKEYVLHLRIATHGLINEGNCHPFKVGNNHYYMHNGTLTINCRNKKMSDTWHFAQFLKTVKLNNRFIDYLGDIVGFNKLIFMNGEHTRTVGNWEDYQGNSWSNLYWQYSGYFGSGFNNSTNRYYSYPTKTTAATGNSLILNKPLVYDSDDKLWD